jgi:hypothetical protein
MSEFLQQVTPIAIGLAVAAIAVISIACIVAAVRVAWETLHECLARLEGWPDEPCPRCGDTGFVEINGGGISTVLPGFSNYAICACPCGDDVRRELARRP